jgi:predicted ATPase/class 3 adenylate cyclase
MPELPRGTVTFLFTDIEGSTRLLQELGDSYAETLAKHRRVLRHAFDSHGGVEVDTQGDAFFVAFARAKDALAAAAEGRDALDGGPIRVRIGLHTGEPLLGDEGYVGLDVHRGARICATAHGGQVVLSGRTRSLLAADSDLVDLGLHRLKDLTEPERLYQLGADQFPPLRSLNATNLPVQPTALVGRERELAEVLAFARSSRLVTLVGAGGSGKTRLALQAAAELVDDFKDGVFWVPLAALAEAELVLPAIAAVLGARDDVAQFVDEKRMLLLLDNLEQIIDAAPALGELLGSCPNLTLLATSRAPLRLAGEQEYEVPLLPEAEARELFAQRARQVKPAFEPDEHVVEICRRLDGLPLALELAAARAKVLSPEQILERLGRSLDLLTSGTRDLPERQRTLRATIEWSYQLLDEDEKRFFSHLAVFAGSFDLEAAEEVGGAGLETLEALVNKSLLRQTHEGRFFLLETIREYGAELLEQSGEADELRRCLAEFYVTRIEAIEEQLFIGDQRRALDEIQADFDNLRAVIERALHQGKVDVVLRLCGALDMFWHARGHVAEAARWLEAALDAGTDAVSPLVRAKTLCSLGTIAALKGDQARADLLLDESIELFRQLPETRDLSYALDAKSEVATAHGDLRRARECAEEAVAVAQRSGDWYRTTSSLDRLAYVALFQGDNAEARRLMNEALRAAREAEQARPIARCLVSLGWLLLLEGESAEAVRLCEEGLDLIRDTNDPKVSSELLHTLGVARLGLGDRGGAADALREALVLAHGLGITPYVRGCFDGLAAVSGADGDPRRSAFLRAVADCLCEVSAEARTEQEEALYGQYVLRACSSIGEEAWTAARAEGRAKSLEEAIQYALEARTDPGGALGAAAPAERS